MNTKMAIYWIYRHYILLGTITYKYLFLKALFEPLNFSQLPLWWDMDEPFPGGFFALNTSKVQLSFFFAALFKHKIVHKYTMVKVDDATPKGVA